MNSCDVLWFGSIFQVTDELFDLRPELGMLYIDNVQFNVHSGTFQLANWMTATPVFEGNHRKSFDIRFKIATLGYSLVHVRFCYESNDNELDCKDMPQSPTVVEVRMRSAYWTAL